MGLIREYTYLTGQHPHLNMVILWRSNYNIGIPLQIKGKISFWIRCIVLDFCTNGCDVKLLEFSYSACGASIANQSTTLANAASIRILYKKLIGLQKDLMPEDEKIAYGCWALQGLK